MKLKKFLSDYIIPLLGFVVVGLIVILIMMTSLYRGVIIGENFDMFIELCSKENGSLGIENAIIIRNCDSTYYCDFFNPRESIIYNPCINYSKLEGLK